MCFTTTFSSPHLDGGGVDFGSWDSIFADWPACFHAIVAGSRSRAPCQPPLPGTQVTLRVGMQLEVSISRALVFIDYP